MSEKKPLVSVLMGSQSDWPVMKKAVDILDQFGIANEVKVISAHRNPDRLHDYAAGARERGLKVIIAGAGMAAALPGAAAALTPLPVLGVPIGTKDLGGLDSLLSMVQMPGGVPVGTLAVGRAGAVNAALLAAAILALSDEKTAAALDAWRAEQNAAVAELPTDT